VAIDFQRDVYCLLGLPIDAVDAPEAIRRIRDAAHRRNPCFLSTPNLNFLIGCRSDSQFRDSVINSDLSIADGMPLVWVARLLRIPLRARITGADLFEQMRISAAHPLSVYFFGGKEGVAEAACRRLNAGPSGLVCVGFESPGSASVEELSTEESIARINASGADFVVVALGAKKGQAWIERNRARLYAPVISHLGAVLNFVAGTLERAPKWMRRWGLEWLWRTKEEPHLWRRYLGDGLALLGLLASRALPYAWYLRRHKPDPAHVANARADAHDEPRQYVIRLQGALTRHNIGVPRAGFSGAALAGKDITLDLIGVAYVDSAFVGLVMLLKAHQARYRRKLLVLAPEGPVMQVFRYCCAEFLFSGTD